jgi:hypothetical protein
VAFAYANRFYRLSYEPGRIARVVAAGTVAALAALWLVPAWPPLISLAARLLVTCGTFVGLLAASGFFRRSERAFVAEIVSKLRRRSNAITG